MKGVRRGKANEYLLLHLCSMAEAVFSHVQSTPTAIATHHASLLLSSDIIWCRRSSMTTPALPPNAAWCNAVCLAASTALVSVNPGKYQNDKQRAVNLK